ncbi:type II toxin-antitoxin system prevent-host-death family antitoxin [Nibricoccus aquaticus]|uniref:Antitoxin n=1 Tax=Nibricoccus aquaticus TaxID=2576891 RepID=A0A290QM22_9BACT|nr:type II toxin-antitoxin system prevent-host-death family antitoxin [Nibricoccus aquaticus]ATC65142.1 type II toxin-antitoxin system prevent-host-death family antitoxin [Nibricoccus aquaticus]
MKTVNIQAAKTHLSRLVEEAATGEEIILAKAGKPIAKLVPYAKTRKARVGGFLKGQIWEAPDCWEADEKLNKLMVEGPLFPDEPGSTMLVAEEKPQS